MVLVLPGMGESRILLMLLRRRPDAALMWAGHALQAATRSTAAAPDVSWSMGDDDDDTLSTAPPSVVSGRTAPVVTASVTLKPPRQPRVTGDDDDVDPEWQRIAAQELCHRVTLYLSTCRVPHFISESTEKQMFTTVVTRCRECDLDDLLNIIEARWPTPTHERHFAAVSNAVRDRIVTEVSAFVKTAADLATMSHADRVEAGLPPSGPPVEGPTALLIARCVVVMGIRGRRRRDLELFKVLGDALTVRINDIRDPHTLSYVLIAFQNSRIRPPNSFLALVGRRLPILNKKHPMAPLPAYRAMMFYDRSGYELMNPYRFLADRVMVHIKEELRREGGGSDFLEPRVVTPLGGGNRFRSSSGGGEGDDDELDEADFALLRELRQGEIRGSAAEDHSDGKLQQEQDEPKSDDSGAKEAKEEATDAADTAQEAQVRADGEVRLDAAMPAYALRPDFASTPEQVVAERAAVAAGQEKEEEEGPLAEIARRRRIRARFHRVTQLRPPQLTRMLLVLGRKFAPRQQYLRPIATELLVPSVAYFNPPSFSRLIKCLRCFQSEEVQLLEAVIDTLCSRGADAAQLGDVLDLLALFSRPNVPLVKADKFFAFCEEVFKDSTKLRPRDMLAITSELLLIRKLKLDDGVTVGGDSPAAFVAPLQSLLCVVDTFALRFASFLDLGLLLLPHADALLDMGNQLEKAASPSPSMSRLLNARQAAVADGEDAYHELVDVDVREIFIRIQVVNSHATHRGFRPLPATLIQEFKAMLDYMRADYILEAVHLYSQAYPNALTAPVRRVLSSFVVAKLELEMAVASGRIPPPPPPPPPESQELPNIDGHRRVFKPYDVTAPKFSPMLFTPATLTKFANIVVATPLQRVQRSRETWRFLELKARQFGNSGLRDVVLERVAAIDAAETQRELEEMKGRSSPRSTVVDPEAFL